jgi:hypothetical protein
MKKATLILLLSIFCFTHVQMGVYLVKTNGEETSLGSKMKVDVAGTDEEHVSDYFLPAPTPKPRPTTKLPRRQSVESRFNFGNCFEGGGWVLGFFNICSI